MRWFQALIVILGLFSLILGLRTYFENLYKPSAKVAPSPGVKDPPLKTPNLPPLPSPIPDSPLPTPQLLPIPKATGKLTTPKQAITTLYGHFPYAQHDQKDLVLVAQYYGRKEYLASEAAPVFLKMKNDAEKEGVSLTIISGFRSINDQENLFQKQIQRLGSKEAAARLSAPAGHSEHHTGYALDIGDGKNPNLDLKYDFAASDAYKWLANNAYKYGFELSFPDGNSQGVNFEPWHWRYVGSNYASQIFANARRNTLP